MSGGRFEYRDYQMNEIADQIDSEIRKSGKKKTDEEIKYSYHDADWYKKYPEDLYNYKYPDEVIAEFKNGINIIRKAAVYAHRIDWLLSDDDGDESFLERLKEDLEKLK